WNSARADTAEGLSLGHVRRDLVPQGPGPGLRLRGGGRPRAERLERRADVLRKDHVHRRLDDAECLRESGLGLVGPALRRSDDTERVQDRGARPDVAAADAAFGLADEPLGFADLALLHEDLRELALGLDEVTLLVRR